MSEFSTLTLKVTLHHGVPHVIDWQLTQWVSQIDPFV